MAGITNFAENKIIDAMFRNQAIGTPANWFFALLVANKGDIARSTAYALNDFVAVAATDGRTHLYKVTTAGTSAAGAPTYTGAIGEVVADGTASLTEQSAFVDDGTALTEVSGGAYARVSVAASLANFAGTQGAGTTVASTGASATTSNNNAVTWPTPTTNWASGGAKIWSVGAFDAASAGNCWYVAPLPAGQTKTVNNGDPAPSLPAAAFTFQLDVAG